MIFITIYKLLLQIVFIYILLLISNFYNIKNNTINNTVNNISYELKKQINNVIINNYIYKENIFYKKSKKTFSKMKKVIYTSILGGYDEIKPFNKEKGFDYFIFSDYYNESNNSNWTFLPIPKEIKNINISIIKKQRYIKLHPHLFFKNYDLSVYIDGSFQIIGGLNELLFRILSPNYNIYNLEHPFRDSIYNEIKEVLLVSKEKESIVNRIANRYRNENFPDKSGLIEGCLIIRKHNNKQCIYLMNKWFNEIMNYSHRDQLITLFGKQE